MHAFDGESGPPPGKSSPPREVIGFAWRVPFLRNIFLICLVIAVFFPVYKWTYLSPSYREMLLVITENNARRAAAHLMRMLALDQSSAFARVDSRMAEMKDLQSDLALEKIKLYDARGKVVFSTEPEDIGEINDHAFFTDKIAKGEVHSNLVRKGFRTLEQRRVDRDLVEVYVPVVSDGEFLGAFEIYYDITALRADLNALLWRSNLFMTLIAVFMLAVAAVMLYKAAATMLIHMQVDRQLQQAHENLEKRVQERTLDLIHSNKDLQLEILDRREAEEALMHSEKRFRTLIETIPYGIIEIDLDGNITFANPAYAKMYCYQKDDIIGHSMFAMVAAEDERRQLRDHLRYVLESQPYPSPWFSKEVTKDGRIIATQVDWNYKRDTQGRVLGLIAVISEITHRKQAEKALLDNLAFMNTMIDTIPNPVFYKDAQGFFLGCNLAYATTLGLPKDKITGRRLIDLESIAFSDMAEHYHRQDLLLIQNPGVQTHEEQVLGADGVLRDYMLFKATFEDTDGAVAGLVGIMLDITARKEVEKELKRSKNLFEAFMRHNPGLAYMKDPQGRYIFVNSAFEQFTATRSEDAVGMNNERIWDLETADLLQTNDQKVIAGKTAATVMETVRLPDGEQRHLLTTRFPVFQDDQLFALGAVSIDITEHTEAEQRRQQLELQLQQAQKMEALGTLAGGIAHDFNNILAAIIGYTEIVIADIKKEDQKHHFLERVLEAGERARSLVRQILTFSRRSEIEPKPVQIKIIVKEVLKLLRASLPSTIHIVQQIQSDAAVLADPVQIHQVMMNLCTNAGYAMREKGGVLTVRLGNTKLDEAFARAHAELKPGDYLKLTVADTGAGIAPQHLHRIFDPFFTTKPQGEGTGMGLSVVHGIVARLGGVVLVESEPGQGARFDVYLPALAGEPARPATQVDALPTGKERILVVDDEPFQTDMLKHLLGLLGYRVETRNRGLDALLRFEEDPRAFDLLITDMIMPDLTGDELARRLLRLRPDLPIILLTGFSERMTDLQAREIGIKAYALKPLVTDELARLIRRVLDGVPVDETA